MAATYDLVTGDTGSVFKVTCKNKSDGSIIDLTGATVHLHWINANGDEVKKVMTVEDPGTGVATYKFAAGEIEAPNMKLEVQITNAAGEKLTVPTLVKLKVRRELVD